MYEYIRMLIAIPLVTVRIVGKNILLCLNVVIIVF